MKAIVMVVLKVEAHGGDVSDGDNDSDHGGENVFNARILKTEVLIDFNNVNIKLQ